MKPSWLDGATSERTSDVADDSTARRVLALLDSVGERLRNKDESEAGDSNG